MNKKRKEYLDEYVKTNYESYCLRFDSVKDKRIIELLDSKPNKTEYIRQLINKELKASRK